MSIHRTRFRLSIVILIALIVIFGLIFLVLENKLDDVFWKNICSQLANIFLIGGIWGGLYEAFLRHDFIKLNDENNDKIIKKIALAKNISNLGLTEVYEASNTYDFTELFTKSKELHIVLNHGRSWISANSFFLKERFEDSSKSTFFYFLNPESKMLDVIAEKEGTTAQSIKDKIIDAIRIINEMSNGETVTILGHNFYNSHALFLGEKYAIVTPYFIASGRLVVPAFKYSNSNRDSFYNKLKADIDSLKYHSTKLTSNNEC